MSRIRATAVNVSLVKVQKRSIQRGTGFKSTDPTEHKTKPASKRSFKVFALSDNGERGKVFLFCLFSLRKEKPKKREKKVGERVRRRERENVLKRAEFH